MNEYQQELNDKIEQLLARNTELESQLGVVKGSALRLQTQIASLDEWLTENAEELGNDKVSELCEMFDLPETTQHEVTLTITATATLELPRGYDLDNLSTYDFTAEITYDGEGDLLEADTDIQEINY